MYGITHLLITRYTHLKFVFLLKECMRNYYNYYKHNTSVCACFLDGRSFKYWLREEDTLYISGEL